MSNDDFGRTNLHMCFYCFDCGSPLTFTYEDGVKIPRYNERQSPQLPTGAAMVKLIQYVRPCESCKRKYSEPVKLFKEALDALRGDDDQ